MPQLFRDFITSTTAISWFSSKPTFFFHRQLSSERPTWVAPRGELVEACKDGYHLKYMADIVFRIPFRSTSLGTDIGWIERVTMDYRGVVTIRHFSLESSITNRGIGTHFLTAMMIFFKKNMATQIEFHETHNTKINHYRQFFLKHNIPETRKGVWCVDLYNGTEIQENVSFYHAKAAIRVTTNNNVE